MTNFNTSWLILSQMCSNFDASTLMFDTSVVWLWNSLSDAFFKSIWSFFHLAIVLLGKKGNTFLFFFELLHSGKRQWEPKSFSPPNNNFQFNKTWPISFDRLEMVFWILVWYLYLRMSYLLLLLSLCYNYLQLNRMRCKKW